MDRKELIQLWQKLYDNDPPLKIGSSFLRHEIAYKLQKQMFGGLKPATERYLLKVVEGVLSGKAVDAPPPATIRVGTRIIREWQGITHEVVVEEKCVVWQGRKYRSLSEVARTITGTRWSGPRFFGVKGAA